MKIQSTAVNFGASVVLLGVVILFPTFARAQSTQSLDGGAQVWDSNFTGDWDGTNKWAGGDDNANLNNNTVTVDDSHGQVTVNNMAFNGGTTTISGDAIEENPFVNYNFQQPIANAGDETFINVNNNATATINSQINLSDLGAGNEQDYLVDSGSGNLTLNNIDFGPYTLQPTRTTDRRVNLAAYGTGHIILNGNYTASGGTGGQFETVGGGGGNYDITASANFASFGSGNIIDVYGGTLNIANSTFTAAQNIGFGNHDNGAHAINIVGAQNLAFSVYDSLKYGNDPDSDGVTTDGTVTVTQTTQDASTMSGGWNLDGSNIALSAVAGSRLTMSGNLGGNSPGGMIVSGAGTVILGRNDYNEEDGNGYIQPTSTTAADLQSGTTLITNGTNGSAFGSATTTGNNPANPGNATTVTEVVKVEAGATLGGNGSSAPKVMAMAATSVITAGDPGQTIPGTGSNPPTVIAPTIGTLRLNGGLEADSGVMLNFKLNGDVANPLLGPIAGVNNDLIFVSDLTLIGPVKVNLTALDSLAIDTPYFLMEGTGGTWTGGAPVFSVTAPAGYTLNMAYGTDGYYFNDGDPGVDLDPSNPNPNTDYDTFSVEFELAPEPSTYGLLGLGLLALVAIARFRRLNA